MEGRLKAIITIGTKTGRNASTAMVHILHINSHIYNIAV